MSQIRAVFVYGTLKTGQCRQRCWPRKPIEIRSAWVYGELYDTGPYPALFAGDDRIGGQVWIFEPEDMSPVITALDEVEEYRPDCQATNLYNRQLVDCFDKDSQVIRAYTYVYGRENERATLRRVRPDYSWGTLRLALWPADAEW